MDKKPVQETIKQLPDQFSLDELIDRLILLNKIDRGNKNFEEGRTSTKEQAKQKLRKWLK